MQRAIGEASKPRKRMPSRREGWVIYIYGQTIGRHGESYSRLPAGYTWTEPTGAASKANQATDRGWA